MEKENKKELIIIFIALIIVFGLGGYYLGYLKGQKNIKAEKELYQSKVQELFPPPANEIKNLSGKINKIVGATIFLEAKDPFDYQGFLKNNQKTKIYKIDVLNNTPILLLDYRFSVEGQQKNISLNDLKEGDNITVFTKENVFNKENVEAAQIQMTLF